MAQSHPSSVQSDGSGEFVEGRLLDGFLLLAAGGSSSPEDVVSVNLSSLQIVEVAAEDLSFFGNLDSLDVSDNQLSDEAILEQFGRLPRLSRLLLSCNAISSLQVPSQQSLRLLEILDLSFNELHGDVLSQLAHLPRLVTLNLSSNCISSVPPEEELYGLQSLEELTLDANDLVQFVQWRALDVLPRLRKLSLASNRVKRLKDDVPDHPGDQISYFESLEELDLSQNEILRVEELPAVKLFRSLRKLVLSDNPCTKTAGASEHTMQGIKFLIQDTKPWYLCGSGSFKRREKLVQPKLKMDRRRMKRVRSSKVGGDTKAKALSSQLGVLDKEANQLLVNLRSGYTGTEGEHQGATTLMPRNLAASGARVETGLVASDDDYTEEELLRIFEQQTLKIESAFNQPVEEPVSFRRAPPFAVSASAGQKLNQQSSMSRQDADVSGVSAATNLGQSGAGAGGGAAPSRPAIFLTGVTDESRNQRYTASGLAAESPGAGKSQLPSAFSNSPSGASLPALATSLAAVSESVGGVLPPLPAPGQPGSRGSSAGGISRSDPLDMLLMDAGARSKPMPDTGVREAMRALRAAAMSEWAVAA
jgi:hypothetical protein